MMWFEDPTRFTNPEPIPKQLHDVAGPRGVATARVFPDGITQPGWGVRPSRRHPDKRFITEYESGAFRAGPRALAHVRQGAPFAIVMRSVRAVMVDLDRHPGAADGFRTARKLELPETLARTSRSGEGRHLFYAFDEPWDPESGYGYFEDAIGLFPGIDIRAVGCGYHHVGQLWNELSDNLTELPDSIRQPLEVRRQRRINNEEALAILATMEPDSEEVMIAHDQLLTDLSKPIPAGKRNSTLFAIGTQMWQAKMPDWDKHILERANEIGLEPREAQLIVRNIPKYGE